VALYLSDGWHIPAPSALGVDALVPLPCASARHPCSADCTCTKPPLGLTRALGSCTTTRSTRSKKKHRLPHMSSATAFLAVASCRFLPTRRLCTRFSTACTVLDSAQPALYSIQHSVHCTRFSTACTVLDSAQPALYSIQHSLHCTLFASPSPQRADPPPEPLVLVILYP
jgi:hypothetical protein